MEIPAIQTRGLTRTFGELTAVQDVTFTVASGQFFGFLGPNGAGKSTTIKMLTGLLEPTAGSIEILGKPFSASALDLKRQIGVVPEGTPDGAGISALCRANVWTGTRDGEPAHGRTA